ncbi:MAG: DUF3365 domain-containing protein [Myxococcales bacterium]|nr:DUF3365 domain-containing protein [Myxococcales bacterium]MCB9643919.1 DUF3365 domain-containing protein [Myxococcales bacterium]
MKQPSLLRLPSLLALLMCSTIFSMTGCKKKAPPPPPAPRVERPRPRPPKRVIVQKPVKPVPRRRPLVIAPMPYFDYERDRTIYEMASWLSSHVAYLMMKTLKKELAGGSTSKAIEACRKTAPQVAREFGKKYNATIQRVSHRNRNPANLANAKEMRLIREFARRIQADDPNLKVLVTSKDKSQKTVYTPIILAAPTCLKCHGSRKKDIDEDVLATLKQHYPKDRATGFKFGDIRGLWKITFTKPAAE